MPNIVCCICKQEKSEEEFHWRNKGVSRQCSCKSCVSAYGKKRRNDPIKREHIKKVKRKYQEENREKVAEMRRRYYLDNKEHLREKNREYIEKTRCHCIYEIKYGNLSYIGETIHFNQRMAQHKSHLSCDKHHCPTMQEIYNKEGWEVFEIRILEEFNNKSTKLDRLKSEIKWIERRLEERRDVINNI